MDIKLNTSSLARHIPIFEEKLGRNQPLRIDLSAKDIKVRFAEFNTDIILEYTLCAAVYLGDASPREVLYDEFPMITSLFASIDRDVLFPNIVALKLNLAKKFTKIKPQRSSMDFTETEYQKFIQTVALTLDEIKNILNDSVMMDGIEFPYTVDELYTTVQFMERSMHIFLEVEENAAEFFEEEFWDDASKPEPEHPPGDKEGSDRADAEDTKTARERKEESDETKKNME